MEIDAVKVSYARWAPVYDKTFGAVTNVGRRRAVAHVNTRRGHVLEVGVGTGLSLEHYQPHLKVTGIDYSTEMLEKSRTKKLARKLENIAALRQMDARDMEFPDNHFDTVVAMHIMSVVPEPERVLSEMARVCKPGGQVLITNHFARDKGPLSVVEKLSAPFANILGWHSDFEIDRVLGEERLSVKGQRPWPPFGMMTFLLLEKRLAA
jgi:phosphatidylethanolamine/phosphatidyl-N-methylethanolamine N-methyltransferase